VVCPGNKVKKVLEWFESLLLAPAIILGTPAEAGLNQKNSTSLTLGTQTAFDYLWDTTLEYCRSGYLPKGPIVSDSLAVVEIRQTL
jgi:hypothetical protein